MDFVTDFHVRQPIWCDFSSGAVSGPALDIVLSGDIGMRRLRRTFEFCRSIRILRQQLRDLSGFVRGKTWAKARKCEK